MPGRRKKTIGGNPVPKEQNGMANRTKGLKAEKAVLDNGHLPPEIREHIFKKMDPEEKITFSNALTTWHELVTKERPDFLSLKGAPILIEHLPKKALLQFRTLSRSWTQALDRSYQEHPDHVRLPFEIGSGKKRIPQLTTSFRSSGAIEKFLEDMKDHSGNPFIGCNVQFLGFGRIMPRMEFWDTCMKLLEQYGQHIYYVKFINVTLLRLCKLFFELPNLKRISLRESWDSPEFPIRTDLPMPQLQHLETLETQSPSKALFEVFMNTCPSPENMKRLSIDPEEFYGIPEVVYGFINLEVLQTELGILDLQKFSKLPRLPPLKEIQLKLNTLTKAHQVFRALEPFANTLTHFKCEHLKTFGDWRWRIAEFNLLNLRKLCLCNFSGALDPFIKLTSLNDLTVAFPDSQNYVEESQVDFYGFQKPLKDSNIWKLIPSLNKLIVGNLIHYRPLPLKRSKIIWKHFYK